MLDKQALDELGCLQLLLTVDRCDVYLVVEIVCIFARSRHVAYLA